jgi:hypothetical protein
MREHLSGIWGRVREKEALAAAGLALCAEPGGFLLMPKLWISAACGLIILLAPIAGAAKVF